ncbi:dTDP-glucose 4,6-dehydratase [bacterium]|nr:dTDP-glucose 4,6-dehydratase [bacterium]
MSTTWLVTGGAGFIGSNFVRLALEESRADKVVVLDALTYAGNLENLLPYLEGDKRLVFVRGDIAKAPDVEAVFAEHAPTQVFHFAAESHVDRSIDDPAPFVYTNVLGTQVLLNAARRHATKRFVMVSTDEVYGALALGTTDRFHEKLPYNPSSPYAASKASADLLAKAMFHTYGMDVVITNCSNNYGPYQFPEKLIPLMIMNAFAGESLPVYGDGLYVRDWIHVEDHCRGVMAVAERGRAGETYCIGTENEQPNIAIVRKILELTGRDESLIRYVKDRPGHDRRYSIDPTKVKAETGWSPQIAWEEGIRSTVEWYRSNAQWLQRIKSGEFRSYYDKMYAGR